MNVGSSISKKRLSRQAPRFLGGAAVFLLLLLNTSSASADVTVSVSPSFLEFAADPGTTFTELITVTNGGTEPTGILVTISPTTQDRPDISATDWIVADPLHSSSS